MQRRPGLATALAACGLLQAGCSVFSPLPAWELVKAGASATSTAITLGPSHASHTVYHWHAPFRQVCIEYNRQSQVEDLLPALQAELKTHAIESRIYDEGSAPELCSIWLRYTAYIDWDTPPLASSHRAYLTSAALTLHTSGGQVLASSRYQLDDILPVGKWTSTRSKIAPVVAAVLTGFED